MFVYDKAQHQMNESKNKNNYFVNFMHHIMTKFIK